MKQIYLFLGALQLIFITLKLTGHVTNPWWQVLLGIEAYLALWLLAALLGLLIAVLKWWEWRNMTPEERATANLAAACCNMSNALKRK